MSESPAARALRNLAYAETSREKAFWKQAADKAMAADEKHQLRPYIEQNRAGTRTLYEYRVLEAQQQRKETRG